MKITNMYGLPDAIVEAVRNDGYSRGKADISVTQLISPPRIVALRHLHEAELEEDASDRIWSLFGQAVHTVLERSSSGEVLGDRLYLAVGGWVVSGATDDLNLSTGVLSDYKVTSVFNAKKGMSEEWEQQLNCYAHMARAAGHTVNAVQIVALMRDWRPGEVAKYDDYPAHKVRVIGARLWADDEAQEYMLRRVWLHRVAREHLPRCTDEERWMQPTRYAVMQKGKQKAVKLCDTEAEALTMCSPIRYVEKRPGKYARCEMYCPVSAFCSQWQADKEKIAC